MSNPQPSHDDLIPSQVGLEAALKEFDDALRERRSQDIIGLLADGCKALIHHQETIVGREAVWKAFKNYFNSLDDSAYLPDYDVVDVIGNRAYVLGSFRDTLHPSDGGPVVSVFGRVVLFWSRVEGQWLITRLLTARSAPDQLDE